MRYNKETKEKIKTTITPYLAKAFRSAPCEFVDWDGLNSLIDYVTSYLITVEEYSGRVFIINPQVLENRE